MMLSRKRGYEDEMGFSPPGKNMRRDGSPEHVGHGRGRMDRDRGMDRDRDMGRVGPPGMDRDFPGRGRGVSTAWPPPELEDMPQHRDRRVRKL